MQILSNVKKLYDGSAAEASAVHTSVDLCVKGGRIESVRPHDPAARSNGDVTVVDASNWTVTPGLIDCHGHITVLGIHTSDLDRMNGPTGIVFIEKILWASLVHGGVTTMRDIGGATLWMKKLVEEGVIAGPRLKIAICMLSTTGGHADFRGPDRCHATISRLWPEAPGRPSSIVDGPWEARKRVREIAACGADLIKLCTSPGVASPTDHLEHRDFSAAEIEAICEEAGARGLRVAAHAHSKSGIELAIRNGVSDIQHISFMDQELADLAYEKGCTVTPTAWVTSELPKAEGISDFVMEKVKKVAAVHAEAVEYARKGGLKILGGTDPVLPGMHGRNWAELVTLARAGLSNLQAWHGMTGLAAQEIGQTDAGTLAPGQRADFLIFDEDAIDDPTAFERGALFEVVQDGRGHRGAVPELPQRGFASSAQEILGLEDFTDARSPLYAPVS